jgi:CMP-N,N'-diacetyllegionaminic acid synthase
MPSSSAGRPRSVALIPARAGSKRVTGKNVRPLAGHPVLAYSIAAALDSGMFDSVMVSTDSEAYAAIARHYGAEVPFLRPAEFAGDLSPDIEWIDHLLRTLQAQGQSFDLFSILRPTSPLRQPQTIRRAHDLFTSQPGADSLRAVEKCKQHPGKMWVIRGQRMLPLLPFGPKEQPWHSTPYQALPEIYIQNASLEIAWTRVVLESRTIAGNTVVPFVTEGLEGFDINDPDNWMVLERLVAEGQATLPAISRPAFV